VKSAASRSDGLLDQLCQPQDSGLFKARPNNLKPDRKPVGGQAGGDARCRKAQQGDQEFWRDPVDIVIETLAVDLWENSTAASS
jgi:hypothetical protein